MQQAMGASARLARPISANMTIECSYGAAALATLWNDLLDNKISPQRGLMVSLLDETGQ